MACKDTVAQDRLHSGSTVSLVPTVRLHATERRRAMELVRQHAACPRTAGGNWSSLPGVQSSSRAEEESDTHSLK